MRIGKLRKRLSVKELSTVPDGAGGTEPTWTEVLSTWGSIKPMKGRRLMEYGQIVQGTPYDITLRYREDLTINKDFKIDFDGKEVILHSVINKDERNNILEIVGYVKQ